jgi:ubiquinone/menaquinone biosynthesis C-methylase UbiE
MIGLQAEKHELVPVENFRSKEEYVLHLLHSAAYVHAERLAQGRKVLDLGCNMGYGTEILARSAREAVGVDVSSNAISAAKSRYAGRPLQFRVVDGGSLPFKNDEFDLVVSCQVIEHVVDYSNYIGEVKRVLHRAGLAVFTTPNSILRLDPGMKPWNTFHVREFTATELKSVLGQFFSNVEVFGLFAHEPLYSIERGRQDRARMEARRNSEKTRGTRLSGWSRLSRQLFRAARRTLGKGRNVLPLDTRFIAEYGTQDFYYSYENLDRALDLLAVCSDDLGNFESVQFQLVKGTQEVK